MALTKCPRCELNYILDGGSLCTICREEVRGKRGADSGIPICSVCGELPALPGEDMCRACLTEMRSIEIISTDGDEEQPVEPVEIDPAPVSSLDEIEAVDAIEGEAEDEPPELDEALDEDLDEGELLERKALIELDDVDVPLDSDAEEGDDEEDEEE